MIGLAANHRTDRNQGVELHRIGHAFEREWNFQRAGHGDMQDIFIGHAQMLQFGQTGRQQAVAHIFVKTRLDNSDAQAITADICFVNSDCHGWPLCVSE